MRVILINNARTPHYDSFIQKSIRIISTYVSLILTDSLKTNKVLKDIATYKSALQDCQAALLRVNEVLDK